MHQPTHNDTYDAPPPGDISDLAHLLRSPPPVPSSPAPAYTALPYRDVDFDLAPMIHGRVGDVELETTDGKRFLVHRKVLEQETVFFHIYYGFIPVWRLANPHIGPPHPHLPSGPPPPHPSTTAAGAIGSLLCLPKFITSHIRASGGTSPSSTGSTGSSDATTITSRDDTRPLLSPDVEDEPSDQPPPPPPKDVTAPTPTSNPYTWAVPESSPILASFLALIYPRGTFSASFEEVLPTMEVTARVIRASMGYQSSKALNIARDRLIAFLPDQPLDVYSTACFFKFTDLARMASQRAITVPSDQWTQENRNMMGRSGIKRLSDLREMRMAGMRGILNGRVEVDGHSDGCVRRMMIQQVWSQKVEQVKKGLKPESELIELLEVDLRGGHCGDCLVLLGQTIQRSILAARDLPKTI